MKWYHVEAWDSKHSKEIGGFICAHTAADALTMAEVNMLRGEPGRYVREIRCITTKTAKGKK